VPRPAVTVPGDFDVWQAWAMRVQTIPERIRWAVDLMDVGPSDNILEIGCGPGHGAELICHRLETGKLFAIDRSESGVDRTKRRCRRFIEAGRLTVRQIDLATLRVPVRRLHKVFAFNVNLFWVRNCADEVALLHDRVLPGGSVFLFYDAHRRELVPNMVEKASAALAGAGFRVSTVDHKAPAVVGIVGKR
jgi:trans-aconitate methyltransferase